MGNVAVDVLLGLGVAVEAICCLGLVVMRTAADRLHFAGAAPTIGPLLILAAVLVRVHLSGAGIQAIAAVLILFLAAPILVAATGRAIRRREKS